MNGIDLSKKRCHWCGLKNPLYVAYHDEEWGVPCHDERKLYEYFILETFQAGLSWECILNKRENFRRAYDGFDLDKVCAYDEAKLEELMRNPGIIRNRAKLRASIENSRIYRMITAEFGGFDAYLRRFAGDQVIREPDINITTSPLSDALSADLKQRGMRFVGSTTIYAFLQAVGVINAHAEECFRFQKTVHRIHRKNNDIRPPLR